MTALSIQSIFELEVYTMPNESKPTENNRLSQATENYLLSLYVLGEDGVTTTASHLAEYLRTLPAGEGLGTSFPTVLSMLRRMVREKLISMGENKEVKLTGRGFDLAEGMVRRHRLAERMVVDILGLDLHKAHIEAHRLEHAISPDIEIKIIEKLGNPTTCPFGRPIPGSEYNREVVDRFTLDKGETNVRYCIDRVPEEDAVLLEFFVEQSILPDEEITIKDASTSLGVITIKTRRGEVAIGYNAAGRIWLRRCI